MYFGHHSLFELKSTICVKPSSGRAMRTNAGTEELLADVVHDELVASRELMRHADMHQFVDRPLTRGRNLGVAKS
jgi:hypothetical protein